MINIGLDPIVEARDYSNPNLVVAFDITPTWECGYFKVVVDQPQAGLNLFVFERPKHVQRDEFVERVKGEMAFHGVTQCNIYSIHPLFALGKDFCLEYQAEVREGEADDPDLGPFHLYTFRLA